MPRRCPDVSSPHLHGGGDLRCRALGKTDAGYGWLRVQLEQPGILLLRRLGPRRAEGSGGRHVRTHWFGHAYLPMSGRMALKKLSGPTDDWQHEPAGTSW